APPHPYQPFNKKNPGASTRAFQSLVPTPLRIQRETPQTESCDACHGNADLFLTIDDIYPEEVEANWGVIVQTVPPPISEYENTAIVPTVTITTTTAVTTTEGTP
ncbi:MAG: hypothetical protein GY803_21815, partial [Chloroflexi bacterium]|nr:hypothetical protein [Chloroflexota bacterium]